MKAFFTRLLPVLSFLAVVVPCQAQYAFTMTTADHDATSGGGEEKPAATPYKMIHGVIQGQAGALPGATVMLKATRTVVVTNSEGEFELRVPADAKMVTLICGYGGLQEEVVTMAPVKAIGSIYLLRNKAVATK